MNKIKISFLVIIGMIISTNVSAQLPVSFGVKAGLNLSEIQKLEDDVRVGFNFGLTADLQLTDNFYLMSGLELTTKGAKGKDFSLADQQGVIYPDVKLNALYLQLPIHAGYKLEVAPTIKLVFRAGPYLAYGISGKIKGEAGSKSLDIDFFDDGTNRFDFGIGGAVGAEFGDKITVSLGADQGLTKIFKDGDQKNRCANISVGYKF
ncbi:MAG: porin family protein [Dysgonomonas sp.]